MDSVSGVGFCVFMVSVLISDDVPDACGISSPKFLKWPPLICVTQFSSFLLKRMSMRLISFLSTSSGLLGRSISLSSFLCQCCRMWPGRVSSILLSTNSCVSGELSLLVIIFMNSSSSP